MANPGMTNVRFRLEWSVCLVGLVLLSSGASVFGPVAIGHRP
jgi:hypothetical protein